MVPITYAKMKCCCHSFLSCVIFQHHHISLSFAVDFLLVKISQLISPKYTDPASANRSPFFTATSLSFQGSYFLYFIYNTSTQQQQQQQQQQHSV